MTGAKINEAFKENVELNIAAVRAPLIESRETGCIVVTYAVLSRAADDTTGNGAL